MNGYDEALAQLLRMPEVTPGHEVSMRFRLARAACWILDANFGH
jgi:hypothetical protein